MINILQRIINTKGGATIQCGHYWVSSPCNKLMQPLQTLIAFHSRSVQLLKVVFSTVRQTLNILNWCYQWLLLEIKYKTSIHTTGMAIYLRAKFLYANTSLVINNYQPPKLDALILLSDIEYFTVDISKLIGHKPIFASKRGIWPSCSILCKFTPEDLR